MTAVLTALPGRYRVLVVDDEPDVHAVTRLSLRGLRYRGRELELLTAASGREALAALAAQPEIAAVLMDVVMETSSAGLDACRAIRGELGNRLTRILLRTGQPGSAPERQTIDEYDIDGYLPKAELTTTRLYAAVRTALKAWDELVELERHRQYLGAVHDCVVSLRPFEPLETTLDRILATAVSICPTPLAILDLHAFEKDGNPRRWFLYLATEPEPQARTAATALAAQLAGRPAGASGTFGGGFVVPIVLHRDLGSGCLYLDRVAPDALAATALPLLAAHAQNALYAAVAQGLLTGRQGSIYDSMMT